MTSQVEKKYVAIGGHVRSKNDRQLHYVSATRLPQLYRVDPRECIILSDRTMNLPNFDWDDYSHLIKLTPDIRGEYDISKLTKGKSK